MTWWILTLPQSSHEGTDTGPNGLLRERWFFSPGYPVLQQLLADGKLAMTEFGDFEGVLLCGRGLLFRLFVVVSGRAVLVRRAHIHQTGVFARSAAICGHSTGPAGAVAALTSIGTFERFVFDVGIGVRREGPDFGDLFGHWDRMLMWENARAMFGREQSFHP